MHRALSFYNIQQRQLREHFSEQTPPLEPFPYSVEGQKDFLITLNQNMMDAGAMGVIYWEPAWISSDMKDLRGTGSSWENCAFFNFSGNATEMLNYLSYEYSCRGF